MYYLNFGHGIEHLPIPAGRFSPVFKNDKEPVPEVRIEEDFVPIEKPLGDIELNEILLGDEIILGDDEEDNKEVDYGDDDEDKADNENKNEDVGDKDEIFFGEERVPEDVPEDVVALKEQAIIPKKRYQKFIEGPVKRLNPRDVNLKKFDYEHLRNLIILLSELTGTDAEILIPHTDDSENRVRMRVNIINLRDRIEASELNFKFLLQKMNLAIEDIRPSDLVYLHSLMEAMTTPRRPLPDNLAYQVQGVASLLGDQLASQLHATFSSNFAAFQAVGKVVANLLSTHKEADKYRKVYIERACRLLTASLLSSLPILYDNYMKSIENHIKSVILTAAMQRAGVTMEDL